MMQPLSRKNALRILSKYTNERNKILEGETISPAERILLDGVVEVGLYQKYLKRTGQRIRAIEKVFKELKFISRSLGIYPPTREEFLELEKAFLMRERMGGRVGTLVFIVGKKGRRIPKLEFLLPPSKGAHPWKDRAGNDVHDRTM